jgi:ATP-dependent helicase/nuclease subunit A
MTENSLPDAEARRKIVEELDRTFFVEAGAGSGKTRSLVDRMIALLRTGRCDIRTLAAVTFTRKAAAELRGRFQVELERRSAAETEPAVRERLLGALRNLEQCAIGTIHSFCARLLRERPVEVSLDPDFVEMEEIEDRVFRDQCWNEYMVKVRLEAEETVRALDETGLAPEDLKEAFDTVALYPEVEVVGGSPDIPDFAEFRRALEQFLELTHGFLPRQRPEKGWDDLQRIIVRCLLRQRNLGFADHRFLMETLELLDKDPRTVWNRWPSKEDGETLKAAFAGFRETVAAEALRQWRECRHDRIVRFLKPAVRFYEERRRAESRLNFGDLLMQAARLLRDNPEVRRYFGPKFTHLLVDEFQDTDPIQAEVLLYLKGADPDERDWQRTRIEPGTLFLVGDPKQSIYRFRRADIDTYNRVKEIVTAGGGEVLALTSNFRSLAPIADWNNPVFRAVFPKEATRHQASFAPLNAARQIRGTIPISESPAEVTGVRKIVLPVVERHRGEDIARADAQVIAEWIRRQNANPSDFLILFRYKKFMHLYARALEERRVPFEITGSDAFAASEEIREIINLAEALNDPDDPIATVAVLRGIFFGLSDDELLEWKRDGGRFNFVSAGREIVKTKKLGAALVGLALAKLKEWRGWTAGMPPSAALEKILEETGVLNYLVSREMGSSRVGNLLKLLEMLRHEESKGATSFAALVAFLEELVEVREIEEISLTPGRGDAVRLMNLHKAKGLEAPVVFLANPAGMKDRAVDKHIARIPDAGDAVRSSLSPNSKAGENRPRGWFVFSKPSGDFQKTVLSQPSGWAAKAAEETRYDRAEEQRLMYVASTRARNLLVVSAYGGELKNKAWGTLDEHLAEVPELEGTARWIRAMAEGEFAFEPLPREKAVVDRAELEAARKSIAANTERAARPSYLVETVTSIARREGAAEAGTWAARWTRGQGGSGEEPTAAAPTARAASSPAGRLAWGRVVHQVLEAVGSGRLSLTRSPQPSPHEGESRGEGGFPAVELFVDNLLIAQELPSTYREDLLALVASIVRSEFWQRVTRSRNRYFEIPFSIRTTESELTVAGPCSPRLRPHGPEATAHSPSHGKTESPREPAVAPTGAGLPVILSGAIDLVFWEEAGDGREAGWVIADYKTDRIPGAKILLKPENRGLGASEIPAVSPEFAAIINFYAPQVRLYTRFWREVTGQPVKECGLYFTSIDRWVKCL